MPKKKDSRAGFLTEEIRQAFVATFTSPSGAKVLETLRILCNEGSTCFTKDPNTTAYLLGQRAVYLEIRGILSLPPGGHDKKVRGKDPFDDNEEEFDD